MGRFKEQVKCCWLTLNRRCNMRCKWCYAQGAKFSEKRELSFDNAIKAVDMIVDIGVKNLTLIGGEPTLWKGLSKLIEYAKLKGISVGLVTNGLELHSRQKLTLLKESGLRNINVSIKGGGSEEYIKNTGVDCYARVLEAVANIIEEKIPYSISYVFTEENISNLIQAVLPFKRMGANNFYFTFCNSVVNDSKIVQELANPIRLIREFEKQYQKLNEEQIKFKLHQIFPNCFWEVNILEEMKAKNQIKTVCQFLDKTGLIFGTALELMFCNMLHECTYGNYGQDFNNGVELQKHLKSEKVLEEYKQILKTPSKDCYNCTDFKNCAGGCSLQWLNYSFEEIKKMRDDYDAKSN